MSAIRLLALALILAMSYVCMGCGSDSSGGRTASRGRFGLKKKKDVAARNKKNAKSDLEDLSPEGSMQRDLKRLQEREVAQAKLVKEMNSNLAQRGGDVQREEDKLKDIRQKIDRYDSAMQRYDMASRARPARDYEGGPAVIPASQFEDRPVQGSRAVYDAGGGQDNLRAAGYGAQRPRGRTAGRNRAFDARQSIAKEGETVLYDPNAYAPAPQSRVPAPQPQYQTAQYPQPQQQQQYQGADDPYRNPFSAPPAPQNRQPEARRAPMPAAGPTPDDGWVPRDNLFSNGARSPQQRPARTEKRFPPIPDATTRQPEAVSPMRPPALPPQAAAPARSVDVAPKKQMPPMPAEDEEVFTPDLFLSGGR